MTGKFLKTALLLLATSMPSSLAADPVQNTIGDTTLTAELVLAEGKTFADGIALITHGTLAHSKMDIVQALQDNLQNAGHSSLAINLSLGNPDREFMYDCKVPHNHRFHDAMVEIESWVTWLKTKGTSSVTVVGHSRGGNQTAWYAAQKPDDIDTKVVLIAPATWIKTRQSEGYEARYKVPLATVLKKARNLSQNGQGDSFMSSTGFLYCPEAKVTADTFLSYYIPDMRFNTPDLLPKISKPTLVVAGSDDKVVRDLGTQMQDRSFGDHVKLEIVDGAGHFYRDLYGEDLSDLVIEFLEK